MDTTTKKPFLFLCIMTILLLPIILNAQESKEKDYEIALAKGQYAIELKDYAGAIGHLKKALELKPGDQAARVSLGLAYARSGDNGKAKEVLQQAVVADASDGRARYELALVLAKLGQQDDAKAHMVMVAKSNEPELSAAAQVFLGEGGTERKTGFGLALSGGLQYDSNVILEQDAPTTPGEKNADWRGVLALNGTYSFLNDERLGAEAAYKLYQSLHRNLSDYNVQQHTAVLAGRYELTKTVSANIEYDFRYTFVGGDHYSTTNWLGLRFPAKLLADSLTELHAAYELKRFFDTPVFKGLTDKNAANAAVGIGHTVMLGKTAGIAVDYTYDADSAEVESWSYAGNKVTVNGLAEWVGHKFFGSLSYYDRQYAAVAPGAPEKRHDGAQEYSVGVSRKAGRDLTVTLSDLYTIHDSNLAVYQYTRNVISLMVEIRL
jgi:tetratricopeptide (TPR) repeat protein